MLSTLKTNDAGHSEASFTGYLSLYPLPTVLIEKETLQLVAANAAAEALFAGPPVVGSFFTHFFTEESRLMVFQRFHQLEQGKTAFPALLLSNNSTPVPVELHCAAYYENGTAYVIVSLVENRQQGLLEEELKKFRAFIANSSEGIFCQEFITAPSASLDADTLIHEQRMNSYLAECNDAFAKMYGYENAKGMIGIRINQLLDFSDPANIEYLKGFIRNGFRVTNAESHEKARNGEEKYFLNNAIGIIENGLLKRIWGTQQDITERKRTEQKLRLMASLVEQTSDILTAADINYIPVTWNKGAEAVYGITAEQAIGSNLREYISIHYTDTSRDEVRRIIAENGEWRGEAFFVRPTDMKTIYLLMCFKAMYDGSKHLGYLVSAIDITERKEAESRLRESENRFREMADSSPVMIWMSDEQNYITYLNQKWIEFTGNNIVGKDGNSWTSLVHKDDLAKANAAYHKAFQSRKQVTLIYRLMHADGNYRWVHDVSVPRFLADGTFIGYIGSVVDIQDQKQKEQQLAYQAMILENVSEIIVTTDLNFKVRSWNKVAEKYYGIREADAIGFKMSELVKFNFNGTDLPGVINSLLHKNGWSGEACFTNNSGETKYVHYTLTAIYDDHNNKIGYLSTGRDITERKVADEMMKTSEQFYRTLIADSLDGIILLDPEGFISFSSPSVKNVLGYDVHEVVGRNAFEFVHMDDLFWASQSFQKEVAENPEIKSIVIRLRKNNGEWLWCMVRGHNMLKNPYINSIVVYFHDDTLRKQASDALKQSEKKFRSLVRDLQMGVFLADARGTILMCNNALSTLLSAPEEEIVGKKLYNFMSSDMIDEKGAVIPMELRPLTLAIRSKQTINNFVVGVLHPLTQERCWIMVNADPIMDENDKIRHVVCSVLDLTERKKLETQLVAEQVEHQKQLTQATIDGQEAERREIGKELHDNIGQQLTTIKLFLDMAKSTADENTQEMISMGLKGVADVINEIRAMSRSLVPSTLQDLGLIESITELVDSIERTQVISISLDHENFDEKMLAENQKLALFRIVQEQLNNIVKHANATEVSISLREKKGKTLLDIRDNGCGFDPRKQRKGLGFINMKNRAELLGGKKELVSIPGKGCHLRISLPLTRPAGDGILAIS